MNRKKCKASGSRATTSNGKDSTVPCDDGEEVVMMEQVGTSVVDLDEDGEQLDYLEVARLLREKLTEFVEGGKGGPPGLELRSLPNMATSRKIISVNSNKMNPVECRTLPKELLLLVFTRLPVPDITRLRSLSKEWNREMATANSEINRACSEARPTMVAGFRRVAGSPKKDFLVEICDLSTHRSQYSYQMHPGNSINDEWFDMGAYDGGLVCFVSAWRPSKVKPLCVVVVNFLTGIRRKLPALLHVYLTPPKMMHIEVDSETKCYRVVVVGEIMKGRPSVEIYDSGAGQWTKATPPVGFLFGDSYTWQYDNYDRTFHNRSRTRSVYDFAGGQLKHYDARVPSRGTSRMVYAHHQDCMFVLHKNTPNGEILQAGGYCITKYRLETNAKDWVQERSYLCSPFEDFPEMDCDLMTLKACEGFLIVLRHRLGNFWLLDLSSGEWSSFPNCFEWHEFGTFMSWAFWNVVP